jgi:hypothetical protein
MSNRLTFTIRIGSVIKRISIVQIIWVKFEDIVIRISQKAAFKRRSRNFLARQTTGKQAAGWRWTLETGQAKPRQKTKQNKTKQKTTRENSL